MASTDKLVAKAFRAYNDGRNDEAEAICRKLAAAAPKDDRAAFLLGMVLRRTSRVEESVQWLRQAVQLRPQSAEFLNGLGTSYSELGQNQPAADCFTRAIQLDPRYADAYYNLGNACERMRDYEKAILLYHKALELNPRDYEAWTNLGKLHKELNQLDEAIAAHDRALQIQPDYALGHWNRAIALMLRGRFPEGWREYEWRWRLGGSVFVPRGYPQPLWRGEPLPEKTLFVHAEQGFGDAIQFVRYVRLARQRAARVVLECPAPLKDLFASNRCADRVIALGEAPPPFHSFVPLMSLPGIFGTTVETIPNSTPYLAAPQCLGLPPTPPNHLRVGLAWAGRPSHDDDAVRSLRLEELAPLLQTPGITFYSLQVPPPTRDEPYLRSLPNFVDLTGRLKDFRHTAALVGEMDLVISVDTVIAHLAGALAKPTWTFIQYSPDWRWLLQRSDTPWYPTMRLFRQPAKGNWQPVITQVAEELRQLGSKGSRRLIPVP